MRLVLDSHMRDVPAFGSSSLSLSGVHPRGLPGPHVKLLTLTTADELEKQRKRVAQNPVPRCFKEVCTLGLGLIQSRPGPRLGTPAPATGRMEGPAWHSERWGRGGGSRSQASLAFPDPPCAWGPAAGALRLGPRLCSGRVWLVGNVPERSHCSVLPSSMERFFVAEILKASEEAKVSRCGVTLCENRFGRSFWGCGV